MWKSLKNPCANRNINWQVVTVFFIEASSSAAYAVFFSGLSLYLTQEHFYSKDAAAVLTGLFLSLNYFLQLIGGLIVNRITSCKKLYCFGMLVSVLGCLLLINGATLKLGLALYLMSSLVSSVCVNMFITKLFNEDQVAERRVAFIWSYVGMNLGFLGGYFLTGYSTLYGNYSALFLMMSVFIFFSLILSHFFIKEIEWGVLVKRSFLMQLIQLSAIIGALVIFIVVMFSYAAICQSYLTLLSLVLLAGVIHYGYKKAGSIEKERFIQFSIYSILAILFWSMYMLTPLAFMQIIANDVQRTLFGIYFAPQWFVNIDSFVILIIAPQLAFILKRQHTTKSDSLLGLDFFTIAFLFISMAFFVLALGFHAAINHGMLSAWIMLAYLILITLGEIFVSPIGNSLIGELIPMHSRGLMTGAWGMNIGIGGLFATVISKKFILPFVNKGGLAGENLQQLDQAIIIISITMSLLTALLFLIRKKFKKQAMLVLQSRALNETEDIV